MTIELIRKADKSELTRNALVAKAKALGYFNKREEDVCPVCGDVRLKFNKTNSPYLYACVKGHRWTQDKWEASKAKCKTSGCKSIIYKTELELNAGYCWKCRPLEDRGAHTTEKKPSTPANKESKEEAQKVVM